MDTKTRPIYMLSTRNPLQKPTKDTYRWKMRGWKNIFHANRNQKKVGVAIVMLDKIDLKIRNITRDKEGHNDQGINPGGRHSNCKYLVTQHRSTSRHKTDTNRHKRRHKRRH